MATPIGSITSSPTIGAAPASGTAPARPGFGESLERLLGTVDASTGAANAAVDQMLSGKGDVHEAMIALQRAELTLQLTVQMRNKIVQAYQDIMRMPI